MRWILKLLPEWEAQFKIVQEQVRQLEKCAPRDASASDLLEYFKNSSLEAGASGQMPDIVTVERLRSIDEVSLLPKPHPWMATNHSNPNIEFYRISGAELDEVSEIVKRHYFEFVSTIRSVHSLSTARAQNVFVISSDDNNRRPVVLKKYLKPRSRAQMRALESIQWRISKFNIFPNYSDYLTPLSRCDVDSAAIGQTRSWVDNAESDKGPYTAFFFFKSLLDGSASHFRGDSIEELEDVSFKLALINNALSSTVLATNPPLWFPIDPTRWEQSLAHVSQSASKPYLPTSVMENAALIERSFQTVAAMVESHLPADPQRVVTLSNHHPHHTFTMHRACVLTCDHEAARNDWPEVANVALAAHRFCREFIRRRVLESDKAASMLHEIANEAALSFCRGYAKGRPLLVHELLASGTKWAIAMNVAKIAEHVKYAIAGLEDPSGCDRSQHEYELNKFITYLMELEMLQHIDWLSKARTQYLG
jgi:hypothetical protein